MIILIVLLLSAIAGVVMGFFLPEVLIGYVIGLPLGIALTSIVYRKLGKKSLKSLVANELFCKLTGYRARVFNIDRQPKNIPIPVTVYGEGHDFADVVDVLKNQMHFKASEAKEAAEHAISVAQGQPLQDQITEALRYFDSEDKKVAQQS